MYNIDNAVCMYIYIYTYIYIICVYIYIYLYLYLYLYIYINYITYNILYIVYHGKFTVYSNISFNICSLYYIIHSIHDIYIYIYIHIHMYIYIYISMDYNVYHITYNI